MNRSKILKSTEVRTTIKVEVSRDELIRALSHGLGIEMPAGANFDIYVRVPGGGDWSNTNLDIDTDSPLIVSWETRDTTEEET